MLILGSRIARAAFGFGIADCLGEQRWELFMNEMGFEGKELIAY